MLIRRLNREHSKCWKIHVANSEFVDGMECGVDGVVVRCEMVCGSMQLQQRLCRRLWWQHRHLCDAVHCIHRQQGV